MERIRTEERIHPHRARGRHRRLPLASVAWGFTLALAVVLAVAWTRARRDVVQLTAELDAARAETAQLRTRMATATAPELAWVRDPRARFAILQGKGSAPQARAQLLYSPQSRQALLWVEGLPPLPESQSYELWVFLGTVPTRVHVFDVAAEATSVISCESAELGQAASQFAVSIEPRGGVSVPTGEVVLMGGSPM